MGDNPVTGNFNILDTKKTCEDVMSQDGRTLYDCTVQRAEPTSSDINIFECSVPEDDARRYNILDKITREIRTLPSLVTTDTIANLDVECKCDTENGCWTSDNNNDDDAIPPQILPCGTSGSPFILSGCERQLCNLPSDIAIQDAGVQISDIFINEDGSGNRNFLPGTGTDTKTRVSYTCDDAHVLSTQMPDDGLDVGHAYAICDTDNTLSFTRTDGTNACLSQCVRPDISNTNFVVTETSLSPENFEVSVNCQSGWSSQSSDERIVANNCTQNPNGDTYTIEGNCVQDCTSDGLDIPSEAELSDYEIRKCEPDDQNNQENVDKCASIKNLYTGPYQYHTDFTSFPDPGLESRCNSTDGCTYTEIDRDNKPSIIIQGPNYGNDSSKVFSHNSNFNIGSKSEQFLQCNESLGYYDNDAKSDQTNFYATMCETAGDQYTLNDGQNDGTNDACFKKIHRVPEDRSSNWVDPYKINVNHDHINDFENPFTVDELANQDIFTCNDGFEFITEFNRPRITEMPPLFALKGCKKRCESETPGIDAGCFYQETEEPFETAKDKNTYMEDFFTKINTENRIEVIEGSELLISADHVNHWREYIFNGKIYREIQVKIDSDEGIIIKGTDCETIDDIHNCRSIHLCEPDEQENCLRTSEFNIFSNGSFSFNNASIPEVYNIPPDPTSSSNPLQIRINFRGPRTDQTIRSALTDESTGETIPDSESFPMPISSTDTHPSPGNSIRIYLIYLTQDNQPSEENLIDRQSSQSNGIEIPYRSTEGAVDGFNHRVDDGTPGNRGDPGINGGSLTLTIPQNISIDGITHNILSTPGKFILKIELSPFIYQSDSIITTHETVIPRIAYKMFEVRDQRPKPIFDDFQRFPSDIITSTDGRSLQIDESRLQSVCDDRFRIAPNYCLYNITNRRFPECSAECYALSKQYLYNCDYPITPPTGQVPNADYWEGNVLPNTQFTEFRDPEGAPVVPDGKTSPFIEGKWQYSSAAREEIINYINRCDREGEFNNDPCRNEGEDYKDNMDLLGENEFCFANIGESCGKQNNKKYNLLKKINDNTKIMLFVLLIIFVIGYLFRKKK